MVENATEKVWILASPEILAEMQKGWSRALQVRASVNQDGSWEMTFRAKYNERGEMIDYPQEES